MSVQRCGRRAIAALTILASLNMTGCANSPHDKSIALAEQGSFFVGGRKLQAPGTYDTTKSPAGTDEGQT